MDCVCTWKQERHKVLFDLGPDDTFLHNAKKCGVDIAAVDTVIISHGHVDHGGGLGAFLPDESYGQGVYSS